MLVSILALAACSKKEEVAAPQATSVPAPATAPLPPERTITQATAAAVPIPVLPDSALAPAGSTALPPGPTPAPDGKPVAAVPGASLAAAPTPASPAAAPASGAASDSDPIAAGLKEALGKGLQRAIAELGKNDGFLTNLNVRIPMPDKVQQVEKAARAVGQGKLADQFIATMNHAAEQAVPTAAGVFSDTLTKMTIQDAQGVLQGPNDAATQFFRRTTDTQLREKFLPIVKEATAKTGVTAAYKQLMGKATFASSFLGSESMDLDGYVATKAMDGLFKMVADEEKRIRENPVARTTDILKSVFGR